MTEHRFEKLDDKTFVCVTDEHKFGIDSFLLAHFSAPRKKDLVCDLGTGCGIIPLIMSRKFSPKMIYGIDVQSNAIDQFQAGIEKSGLTKTIVPVCQDLTNLSDLPFGGFDIVTCNPPYKAGGAGILSQKVSDKFARHEILCKIEDVCKAASKLLKFGGKLYVCQRPERLVDVITAMRAAGIEPKTLRFVSKNATSDPWLFLIEGKKGSNPFIKVVAPLSVYDGDDYSTEMKSIYGFTDTKK